MDRDEIDVDLREVDEQILDRLEEGRCSRQYLAEQLDVTAEYVYQRVDLLEKLGLVEVIHPGFYRLAGHRSIALDTETWDRLTELTDPDESIQAVVTRLLAIKPETVERLAQHKQPDESIDAFVTRLLDD